MIRRVLLLSLVVLTLVPRTARADEPISVGDYRRAVEEALALVNQATTEPVAAKRQTLMDQAAARLQPIQRVQVSPNEQESVDNTSLLADIKAAASSVDRVKNVQARLQALRAALVDLPMAESEANRAKLRDILNNPPFIAAPATNPLSALLERFANWLDQLLSNTIGTVLDLRDFITILGFVLIAVLVGLFARSLIGNWVAETQLPADAEAGDHTSGGALAQAQQFAAQGDYRTAVRQLYLAALYLLDEYGVLRYDHTLTNREYLRAVAKQPGLAQALAPIVQTFDRTWYGFESISREDFDAYRRQVETIKQIAARTSTSD